MSFKNHPRILCCRTLETLQEIRNYLMFVQKAAWFWRMVFKHRTEREDDQSMSHQNPELKDSISMASLWKFQRAQVKALGAVSKLLYRLTELFIQGAPGSKCSSLSQPRIFSILSICTNLFLPFFVVLWFSLPWVGDWQTEHNVLEKSELWDFSLHIRGEIQT